MPSFYVKQSWFMMRTQRPVSVNSQVRPTCAWFYSQIMVPVDVYGLADGPLWGAFGGVVVEPDVDRKRSGDGNVSYVSPDPNWGGAGPVAGGLQGRYCNVADPINVQHE